MKKALKILSLTFTVCLICYMLSANVFAISTTDEGLKFKSYGDGTCYLHRSSTYAATDVVIPTHSPEGDTVVCIDDEAFYYHSQIKSITMPDTIVNIGEGSFAGCSGLTNIIIPNTVTSISGYAFSACTGLESITIPSGVTQIGYYSFSYCDNITSVAIPASITELGNYVFSFCPRLENISVDNANTTYHSKSNCIIKTESKTLMLACKNSVIPSDGSVTNIGEGAFAGCVDLTDITLPDGITSIGANAFYDCQNLVSITIPSTVTSIDSGAFSDCKRLEKIYYNGSAEEWNAIVKEDYWDLGAGESSAEGIYSVECSLSATDDSTTNTPSTEAPTSENQPTTQASVEQLTEAPSTNDSKKAAGCGSSVSLLSFSVAIIATTCTALTINKKDN